MSAPPLTNKDRLFIARPSNWIKTNDRTFQSPRDASRYFLLTVKHDTLENLTRAICLHRANVQGIINYIIDAGGTFLLLKTISWE